MRTLEAIIAELKRQSPDTIIRGKNAVVIGILDLHALVRAIDEARKRVRFERRPLARDR